MATADLPRQRNDPRAPRRQRNVGIRSGLDASSAAPERQGEGARVVAAEREGPADRAGIEPGDVIVRFGERQVQRLQDVASVVLGGEPGERMAIDLVRNGKPAAAEVRLAPLPTQQATP
jgi:serine protease Do